MPTKKKGICIVEVVAFWVLRTCLGFQFTHGSVFLKSGNGNS